MAYDGFLSMGGVELSNRARLNAYMDAFMPGILKPCECECGSLPTALGDLSGYTTPVSDDAPWVDVDDPDSSDFMGTMIVSMRGLDDGSRRVAYTESLTYGGSASGYQDPVREGRIVMAMFARSDRGMESGWRWLRKAVEDTCSDPCSDGTDLCFFSACPPEGMTRGVQRSETVDLTTLTPVMGGWDGRTLTVPDSADPQPFYSLPLGVPGPEGFWSTEGMTEGPPGWFTPPPVAGLRTPKEEGGQECGPASWTFELSGTSKVLARVVTVEGEVSREVVHLTPGGPVEVTVTDSPAMSGRAWVELWSRSDVVVGSLTRSWYEEPDAASTRADQYRRLLHDVVVAQPPRILTESDLPDGGRVRQVEFSVAALTPSIFGVPSTLVASYHGQDFTRLGATVGAWNGSIGPCEPRPDDLLVDPHCPPLAPLPTVPDISLGCASVDEDSWGSRRLVEIPGSVLKDWSESVPVVDLHSDGAVNGIRVRFFPRLTDDALLDDMDGCSACAQFEVTYLPPNSIMRIDGMRRSVTVTEPGGRSRPASHLVVSGRGQVPLEWPELGCGSGYFMLVETVGGNLGGFTLALATKE